MNSIKVFSILASLYLYGCSSSSNHSVPSQPIDVYDQAQKEFNKQNYKESLILFNEYIDNNKKTANSTSNKRVFWAIDQVSRIHLKINKDTSRAIAFLESVLKTIQLTDAQEDDINEWLSVAKYFKKMGRLPVNIKNSEELFKLGKKYYKQGSKKLEYPADDAGNADFYIASTYLIPYVYSYDDGEHIGEALFILGNIRLRSWNDYEYWTENFYLKEVIRRFPNTLLSKKSYALLEEGIRAGYTGSGGDYTPPSQLKMLKELKRLSTLKK